MTGTFPSLKNLGGHNTVEDLAFGVPAAALGGLGLAGLAGAGGLGAAGAAGAADVGATAAGAGAPLDLLAGGAAAGSAIPAAVGDIVAPTGALASGLATEPGFAGSVAGGFAPGLSTGSGFLAGLAPSGIGGAGPAAPGAGGLSNAAISGLESSPGAGAFADTALGAPLDTSPTIGPGAPAPAAAGAAPGGLSSLFPAGSGQLATILGLGLGGSLLAPSLMNALGLNKVPQQAQLQGIANQAQGVFGSQQAYGTALEQPLATGTLPQAQQAQVDQALQSANAITQSKFANLGLSGSTMEAEALSQNQQQSLALTATLENQMAQTGQAAIGEAVSALGIQDSTIGQIMNAQVAQDTALQTSIGNFAAAVGGGTALGNALKPAITKTS